MSPTPSGATRSTTGGERFVGCDYWSGQMMAEVAREIASARGPVYLKLTHLPEETISALEDILHTTERPTRGTFHAGRGHDYRTHDVEMHISEIGLCGGTPPRAYGYENAVTTVPGLYAAGDLACVPHNYMIGAFVFGDLAAHAAAPRGRGRGPRGPRPARRPAAGPDRGGPRADLQPLRNPDGRRRPRSSTSCGASSTTTSRRRRRRPSAIALETFGRMTAEIARMGARTPHELMRCAEVTFIRDCAELATRASLARTESRWGLYHDRADHPRRDDAEWFWHPNIRRGADRNPELLKRPVGAYIVPVSESRVRTRTRRGARPHPWATRSRARRPGRYGPPLRGVARPPGILGTAAARGAEPSVPRLRRTWPTPTRGSARGDRRADRDRAAGAALAQAADDDNGTVRHAAVAGLRGWSPSCLPMTRHARRPARPAGRCRPRRPVRGARSAQGDARRRRRGISGRAIRRRPPGTAACGQRAGFAGAARLLAGRPRTRSREVCASPSLTGWRR